MSNENMYCAIALAVQADAGRIALETQTGKQYSYADVDAWSARYANYLVGQGFERGDRIAVQVEKSPQSLFLYLACLRAGLVYLPLNTAYQSAELEYLLGDSQPRLIVARPQNQGLLKELSAARARATVMTLDDSDDGSLAGSAAQAAAHFGTVSAAPEEVAVIIYTSGTTGRSKGAMLTHRNLTSNARALVSIWGFTEHDVLLHTLPVFHVHGLFVANHCALTTGATMLWHQRFDPQAAIAAFGRATVFMGVPTFYVRLLAQNDFGRAQCTKLRLFISGSAPLLAQTHREFEARTGHRIVERYGMSETGMITSNPLDGERRPGTVGLPLPGVEVRVAGPEDRALPSREVGAIQVRGENVFAGYWRMPEKTREEFTADGWFRTGDLGLFDADGYLSIVGRAKDLIITGGYNVYPKEVELALDELPGVAESAVVGVPHADFGEAVTAAVVPKAGARIDEAQVIAALKSRLANYKVPKRVYLVEELPRNAMGKVQKSTLRRRFGGA
ncbi:MAG: malonate--CoA ligase [Burkholderiales bacterium]